MATVGFDAVKISILDSSEKAQSDKTYTIDKSGGGAIEANITGLAPTETVLYASNVPFYVSAKGTGSPKMVLTAGDLEDLPAGALDAILGRSQDPTTKITTVGSDTEAPYCVVELITKDKQGQPLYISLLKGKFSKDGDDVKTSDNNGSVLSQDQLNFTGVARQSDGLVYAKGRGADGVTQGAFEGFIFGTNISVTGVSLTPSTATLSLAGTKTVQLTATVSPENATNPAVTYSSSNTSIATVSSSGLVTGVAAGTATITATTTDGNYKDVTNITVTA